MPRKGLGKGLDSLIPKFYDEDFDSNSAQSLEDMLNDMEEKTPEEEKSTGEKKNIFEELEEENVEKDGSTSTPDEEIEDKKPDELQEQGFDEDDKTPESISSDKGIEDSPQTPQESEESQKIQVNPAHVDEVKEIVDKNPRITLWSARSSAVFRYLRKTEPEFSISKEASTLIDEAVSKKYPEIWELFDDY